MKKITIVFTLVLACLVTLYTTHCGVCPADSSSPPVEITEEDGSPSVYPYQIKFTNDAVTDNGDGTVSVATGGGSGAPTTAHYYTDQAESGLSDEIVLTGLSALNGIAKGNGSGAFSAATAGTDYYSTLDHLKSAVSNDFHNLGGTDNARNAGNYLTLTGNTLDVNHAFVLLTGDTMSGDLICPGLIMTGNTISLNNIQYVLPSDNGDAGEQLQTDGAGVITWEPKDVITAGDYITRTGDDLDVDHAFVLLTGDTITGALVITGNTITATSAAASVNTLAVGGNTLTIVEGALTDSTVVTGDIKDNTITADDIAADAIKASELDVTDVSDDIAADIAEGELADSIVVSADIKDGTIAGGDLASNIDITTSGAVTISGNTLSATNAAASVNTLTVGGNTITASSATMTVSGITVSGTATISGNTMTFGSNIKGMPFHIYKTIIDPLSVQTEDNEICLVPAINAAITITRLVVTLDATTNEVAGDLKYADTFIGLANATVINAFDTSSGALDDSSITSGAVASGKCIYLSFDSAPNTAIHQMCIDITGDYD